MKHALRCFGYVLAGIGAVALAGVAALAAVGALFWLSLATANWFDIPQYAFAFGVGYFVLVAGGVVGVTLCREDRT